MRTLPLQPLLAALAEEVAGEDPRAGEQLARLVDLPFGHVAGAASGGQQGLFEDDGWGWEL